MLDHIKGGDNIVSGGGKAIRFRRTNTDSGASELGVRLVCRVLRIFKAFDLEPSRLRFQQELAMPATDLEQARMSRRKQGA